MHFLISWLGPKYELTFGTNQNTRNAIFGVKNLIRPLIFHMVTLLWNILFPLILFSQSSTHFCVIQIWQSSMRRAWFKKKKIAQTLAECKTHLMECILPIPFDKKCLFYLFPPSRTNIHISKLRTVNKFDLQWFVRNTQQSRLHTDWRIVIFQDKPLYQLKMITHKLE